MADKVSTVNVGIYTVGEQFAVPWAARGTDLLHVPHYNVPVFHPGPMVVSILDLIHLSEGYKKDWQVQLYASAMLRFAARRAQHIFTLSEFSRREIVTRLGVKEEKVTAIPCGVHPEFRPLPKTGSRAVVEAQTGIKGDFLLYVGNLKPHKNIPTLLRGYAALSTSLREQFRLLVLGEDAKALPGLQAQADQLGIAPRVVWQSRVQRATLPHLYNAATLTVVPSLLEGFGLPVVESMACGTPVVASHAASLPEAGGSAAVYFDPCSPDSLATELARLLASPGLCENLSASGIAHASGFSWQKAAAAHVEIYEKVLGG